MKLRLQIPHVAASTIDAGPGQYHPVLDGRDVVVRNRWNLPPQTVALAGRRAVFFALDIMQWHWEADFGGHLYLIVTRDDAATATIVEAGPMHPNGTGGLVPYAYPEDEFEERRIADFDPEILTPPHGLTPAGFCDLVLRVHRAYDGNQRYLAVEIPFLRVGRDSNSYAIGVLLACGVDPRAIPRGPREAKHRELLGYPGAEDPVHRANFGHYPGTPAGLGGGATEQAFHDERGDVHYVVVGGEPGGQARLPAGTTVELDRFGRIVFTAEDARAHGLPTRHTDPPDHIRFRPRFPAHPEPQGACITLLCGDRPVPLARGSRYRGIVSRRDDALGIAILRTSDGDCVLPLPEIGVEMRDPKRVDALFQIGNDVTVGLHSDRHPKLVSHGPARIDDALSGRRFHAPRPVNVAGTVAVGAVAVALAAVWWSRRRL